MRKTVGYPAFALTLAFSAGFGLASLPYDGRAGEAVLFFACVALALVAIAATILGQLAVDDEAREAWRVARWLNADKED